MQSSISMQKYWFLLRFQSWRPHLVTTLIDTKYSTLFWSFGWRETKDKYEARRFSLEGILQIRRGIHEWQNWFKVRFIFGSRAWSKASSCSIQNTFAWVQFVSGKPSRLKGKYFGLAWIDEQVRENNFISNFRVTISR